MFETLFTYGRLSLQAILTRTWLTPRQARHSLAVLVQQNLASWYTSPEDNTTYYEAHLGNAYALIRFGKIIKSAEDSFGEVASGIISNLLLLGHARVGDLVQAYNLAETEEHSRHAKATTNGVDSSNKPLSSYTTKGHFTNNARNQGLNLEKFHSTVSTLLQSGLVSIVHESHFRSLADNRGEAEKIVKSLPKFQGNLKTDQKAELEEAINQKLADWRDGTELERKAIAGLNKSKKRSLEDPGPDKNRKRMRLDEGVSQINGYTNGTEALQPFYLDNDSVLRVNHDHYDVFARNAALVNLAEKSIGKETSAVYGMLLGLLEHDIRRCRERTKPDESDEELNAASLLKISTFELSSSLTDNICLEESVGKVDSSKIDTGQVRRVKTNGYKVESGDEAEVDGMASADEEDEADDGDPNGHVSGVDTENDAAIDEDADFTPEYRVSKEDHTSPVSHTSHNISPLCQHLLLLAEHPYQFVNLVPRTKSATEKWSVNFTSLSRLLCQLEIEFLISSRYGVLGTRIVRILTEKGKLDEKALTNIGLINQKVMRSILTTMHEAGYLELQEIPRDNQRQPSRTMYFWFFDRERCAQKVLGDTYKAMARCLQRVQVEREAVKAVIEKAERTDVVGREEEYLSIDERSALESWREKEERILGELGRLDDLVAILRDF